MSGSAVIYGTLFEYLPVSWLAVVSSLNGLVVFATNSRAVDGWFDMHFHFLFLFNTFYLIMAIDLYSRRKKHRKCHSDLYKIV